MTDKLLAEPQSNALDGPHQEKPAPDKVEVGRIIKELEKEWGEAPSPFRSPFRWWRFRGRHADWEEIRLEVQGRYQLLIDKAYPTVRNGLDVSQEDALALAATDVFVEKAQYRLTRRAGILVSLGSLTAFATAALIVGTAGFLLSAEIPAIPSTSSNYWLTLYLLKTISAGGFAGVGAYYLGGLSRALLHEASVLYNRRHALRFGRLCVYLQGGRVDSKELHDLFRWNDSPDSAFRDIDPRLMKQVGLSRLIDVLPEITKNLGEGLKEVAKVVKK